MVYRIYVEKKPGFDVEAEGLKNELVSLLGVSGLTGLRLLNRYDVEGIDEALFQQCASTVFSEPPVDDTYDALPQFEGVSFAASSEPTVINRLAESSACSRVYTIPTTQPRLHSPNLHSPNQCRNIGISYGEQRITHATINRSNSGLHRIHRHPRP